MWEAGAPVTVISMRASLRRQRYCGPAGGKSVSCRLAGRPSGTGNSKKPTDGLSCYSTARASRRSSLSTSSRYQMTLKRIMVSITAAEKSHFKKQARMNGMQACIYGGENIVAVFASSTIAVCNLVVNVTRSPVTTACQMMNVAI